MVRHCLLFLLLFQFCVYRTDAQKLTGVIPSSIQAINIWEKGADNFFYVRQYVNVANLKGSVDASKVYNYDKKNRALYVKFGNSNCILTLTPTSVKLLKKQLKTYKIPRLNDEELQDKQLQVNSELRTYFNHLNDSINIAKKEAEKRARERKAREDSIRLDTYRRTHDWQFMTIKSTLYCEECEESHTNDSIYVLSLSNDSIAYFQFKPAEEMLGYELRLVHYSKISNALSNDAKYKEYCTIWKDSIADNQYKSNRLNYLYNRLTTNIFFENIRKEAPYGYIIDWGWNLNSAAGIETRFKYMNTNSKTIRYIDFYFSVYNEVGDICPIMGSGSVAHVRGVGPLEQFESASWDWDHATHCTSYSATNMKLVKLVITYMDKSVRTITRNNIVYE